MKKLLVLLIFIALVSDVLAQKPWKWTRLNGPNIGRHDAELTFGPNGEIISLGNSGYYQTTNDGQSWVYHKIIASFNCIQDYDYSIGTGFLISTSGVNFFYFRSCDTADNDIMGVYRSTDNGVTWKQILSRKYIYSIQEWTNKIFIATGDGCFESIDEGNSWVEIFPQISVNLLAVTDKFFFYKQSGDARLFQCNLNTKQTTEVRFGYGNYNDTSGIVVRSDGTFLAFWNSILYSSDGISKWDTVGTLPGVKSMLRGSDNNLYASVMPDQNMLYIAYSSDMGKSWSRLGSIGDFWRYDTYTFFPQSPDAMLVENDSALFLSRDRGKSWETIGLPFDSVTKITVSDDGRLFTQRPLNSIQFQIVHNGYPYTTYSAREYTPEISSDKGKNWIKTQPVTIPIIMTSYITSTPGISNFGKGMKGTIIAVAPDSNEAFNSVWIFDSVQPNQWQRLSVTESISAPSLITSDGTKSIYIATGSTIYRSDDTGFSWINLNPPDAANGISALDANSEGTLYFGTYPIMYRSDDHGATWIKLEPTHDIVKLSYIKTFGTDGVLLGTEGAGLLISNDKGNSWSRQDGNNFDTVTCIALTSKGEIAAGTNRGLWLLDSTRHSWSKVSLGSDNNLYIGGIDVSNADDFYVGTYGSSVWLGTRNYSSVQYAGNPNSSMRITPNPSSGKITIYLPSEDHARLELYDILGRRIALLADGTVGEQISYNIPNLPNGIYTLTLTGAKNEMQKVIVNH
jgi:photosystem II stability/assembly factor-like uncharacterized protein